LPERRQRKRELSDDLARVLSEHDLFVPAFEN
jgi:hypothetical protein